MPWQNGLFIMLLKMRKNKILFFFKNFNLFNNSLKINFNEINYFKIINKNTLKKEICIAIYVEIIME